jgi:HEAT repeat protein
MTGGVGETAEHYAEDLVQKLNSLQNLDRVAAQLMACGAAAIPPVTRFLLFGKPGVVYLPRRAAVEILGALGAKDPLIEYLTRKKSIPDPAVQMAEEAVENAAARELARWRTQDILDILMRFALPGSRSGVVEALGQFGCPEALPYFVRALEDDFCRTAAEEAIRALGRSAEIALIAAARTQLPSSDEERPSSRRRRAAALELLAELRPSPESWPLLRALLEDGDAGIATAAARIAAMLGSHEDRVTAVDRLLSVLPAADWFLRAGIQDCLLSLYGDGRPRMEREIANRSALPAAQQTADPVLRALLNVRCRAEQSPRQGSTE